MKLKKIKPDRRRLADEVYEQILAAIQSNEIGGDDRLVQERLAAELQISRTPVREALLRLEQNGILRTSARGGFVIHRMTGAEVKHIYQARAAIEGQAARILAEENSAGKIARIRQKILREENITRPSTVAYFNANRAIHRSFVEQAGNHYLTDMFDNIWNRGTSFQLFAAIEKLDLAKSLGDHMSLLEAVETGRPAIAMEAVIEHIWAGYHLQMEALEAR